MLDTKTRWLYDQIIARIDKDQNVVSSALMGIPSSYTDEEVESAIKEIYTWIEECKSMATCKDVKEYCTEKLSHKGESI